MLPRAITTVIFCAGLPCLGSLLKRRLQFVCVALLAALLAIAGANFSLASVPASGSVTQPLSQQGHVLYQEGRLAEAVGNWEQALSTANPAEQVSLLTHLAIAHQSLGDLPAATATLQTGTTLLADLSPATTPEYWFLQARLENSWGGLLWAQGDIDQALVHWQTAAAAYARAEDVQGELGSLINQSMGLRALGLLSQSEMVLDRVATHLTQLSDTELKAKGLRQLGITLRQVGKLDRAEQVLEQSLAESAVPTDQGLSYLELGNVQRALAKRAVNTGQQAIARSKVDRAVASYAQASRQLPDSSSLQAQLNQLSLAVDTGQTSSAIAQVPPILSAVTELSPGREATYARLNLSHSLMCLYPEATQGCDRIFPTAATSETLPPLRQIADLIGSAVNQAKQSQDRKAESYALGELGTLYEFTQQWSQAQDLTQQALLALEGLSAPEIRYRWEWQQGRLYNRQAQYAQAKASYKSAVKTLTRIRSDLLTIDPEVQFSFRDNVEPVYREFIDLMLRDTEAASPDVLQAVIDQANALKLAEIENFLGCTLANRLTVDRALAQIDPTAAFVYPIVLRDRIEVIFNLPDQPLQHQATLINSNEAESILDELRQALLGRDAGTVIDLSSRVYQWLIKPVEDHISPAQPPKTLVFVLDGSLRNIPMSVLYDAQTQQYLAEKPYSLVLLPNAQLFDLSASQRQLSVLGAGVSEARTINNRQFEALNTDVELAALQTVAPSEVLLNQQFTLLNLQQQFQDAPFSIMHLATHGKFSSNPEETYVLAYDELLRSGDLETLIAESTNKNQTIDLLVLSACQTATSDSRATLGLAGIAVRSGAKSTLATLWQVSDDSTVRFMSLFYEALSQPGTSKAAALRMAQQQLLQQPEYQNPYYWASYALVGNWR